jgi:hypothetical protein
MWVNYAAEESENASNRKKRLVDGGAQNLMTEKVRFVLIHF